MKTYFTIIGFLLVISSNLSAAQIGDMEVSGAFFGIANSIHQNDAPDEFPSRNQFDFAANLDVGWQIHQKIKGTLQLQMGSGEGSLGFGEASATLTDINLDFLLHRQFTLTFGSFDTPFGMDTPYLTNNADPSNNPLVLNSLFYAVFAGTHVGTLNTLGLMGNYTSDYGNIILALTNGTDEASINSDGGFELVASVTSPEIFNTVKFGFSAMMSEDSSVSGSNGTGAKFSGFMADAHFRLGNNTAVRGYFGNLVYDDDASQSKDDVMIYKMEANQKFKNTMVAVRYSGWIPDDNDGDMAGYSTALPMAGLAQTGAGLAVPLDQDVKRIQLGISHELTANAFFRGEVFLDDYAKSYNDKSADVIGALVGINILFE